MATRSEHQVVGFHELDFGKNGRYDYGNLEELAHSIAENGVREIMSGYKEKADNGVTTKYVIENGHRRYRAIEYGIKNGIINADELKIRIFVIPKPSEEARQLGYITSNDGKRLTMLEEALVYENLMNISKYSQADLKKKTGKSMTHINNQMVLLSASGEVKEMIKQGKIKATLVIEMLKDGTPSEDIVYAVTNALAKSKTPEAEDDSTTGDVSGDKSAESDGDDHKKKEANANVKSKPAAKLKEAKAGKATVTKKDITPKKEIVKIEHEVLKKEVQELAAMEGVNEAKMDSIIGFTQYMMGEMTFDDLKDLLK